MWVGGSSSAECEPQNTELLREDGDGVFDELETIVSSDEDKGFGP